MAIYHYHRSIGKRTAGKNAVFAAAYIRGEKRTCDRTGETNDFSDKIDVIYTNTFLPDDSPVWASELRNKKIVDENGNKQADETGVLFSTYAWNQIEFSEKRIDSQLYFHDDIAIPNSLTKEQAIELVDDFVKSSLAINGIFCDVAIHWDDNNHHAHILMPLRALTDNGFSKKIRVSPTILANEIIRVREAWAVAANQKMQTVGIDERIDHRSNRARGIDLEPTVKIGKFSHLFDNDIRERKIKENELIKKLNVDLILRNPSILSEKIMQENLTFDDKTVFDELKRQGIEDRNFNIEVKTNTSIDPILEKLLLSIQGDDAIFNVRSLKSKLKDAIESPSERERIYQAIISNDSIYALGLGEDGRQHYVGRQSFDLEKELLRSVYELSQKNTFNVSKSRVIKVSETFGLNEAQTSALLHITRGSNVSVVCGYAGTGKTYMLKAAKSIWDDAGFKVIGLSMSGKAVSGLESDTGIESKTIYSFLRAVENKQIVVDDKTILVMDEMGMTSLDDMHAVMDIARKAGAKMTGVGDIEQTQPVGRGAPQRAMVEEIGAVYLDTIIRQEQEWMRQATILFETNQTADGFDLYDQHGSVYLYETDAILMTKTVEQWHAMHDGQSDVSLKDCMITAFKNETVDSLNIMARDALLSSGLIDAGIRVSSEKGDIQIAAGERLLFTKNDYKTGVKNGDFATVLSLDTHLMTVQLDSGNTVNIPLNQFKQFKYGYAATVHKLQGYTGKHMNVLIDGQGWDRHKFLVACTRHKLSLNVHASNASFASMAHLKESVSRHGLNDILYDFPVAYAQRRGFDVDDMAVKATGFIQKAKARVIDAVGFLFNVQTAIEQGESAYTLGEEVIQKRRKDAVMVAEFSDNRVDVAVKLDLLKTLEGVEKDIGMREVYALQLRNGLIASTIKANPDQYTIAVERNRIGSEKIDSAALFYTRHLHVKSLVEAHDASPIHNPISAFQVIDGMKTHYGHVCHLIEDSSARNAFLRELAHCADNHRRDTALEVFGVEHRALINIAMRYKTLDYEVGTRLSNTFDANDDDKQALYERSTTRDQLAAELLKNPQVQAIIKHFAIKQDRLEKHASKYEDRRFVQAFSENSPSSHTQGNLSKQAAAHHIKANPKRYGIFLDEFLPDGWKTVNLENWFYERRLTIAQSSVEYKQSIQQVRGYKVAASAAYQQWQKAIARSNKQSPNKNKGFKQAQGMTWARSLLAHDIMKNPSKHVAALSLEKVDTVKLYQQSLQVDYLNRYRVETRDTLKLHMAKHIHDNLKNFQAGLAVYGLYQDVKERAAHFAYLKRVKDAPNQEMKSLIRAALDYQDKKVEAGKVWGQVKTLQQLKIDTRGLGSQAKQLRLQRNEAAFALLQSGVNLDLLTRDLTGVNLNVATLQREAHQHTSHQMVLRYLSATPDNRAELAREMLANKAGYHLLFDYNISFDTLKKDVQFAERQALLTPPPPHAVSSVKQPLWDIDRITQALMQHPVETYTAILGEPKEHNASHLRYPGGLIVSTQGPDAGKWYSFTEEVGGTPLGAIQKYLSQSFPDALAYGASLAGLSEYDAKLNTHPIGIKREVPESIDTSQVQKRNNGILSAQSIWDGTLAVDGTLAARYFSEHRQVANLDGMEIRYWPKGASWVDFDAEGVRVERPNKIPAAVIAARNAEGVVVSVQRIYLDEKTAGKNTFLKDAKLTKGSNKGAPGVIQAGTPGGTLYIAEGPETAASIASLDKQATVLTSFSVSNIANMADVIKTYAPARVIIAADNDGVASAARTTTEKACHILRNEGLDARIVYPPMLPNKTKTDWNDILVEQGHDALTKTFEAGVKQSMTLYETGTPMTDEMAERYFAEHKLAVDISDIRVLAQVDYKGQSIPALMLPRHNEKGLLAGEIVLALASDGKSILGERISFTPQEGTYIAQRGQVNTLYITSNLMHAKLTAAKKPKATVVYSRSGDYAALHKHLNTIGIKPTAVYVVTNDQSHDKQMLMAEKCHPFHADGATLSLVTGPNVPELKSIKLDPNALEKARLKMSFEKLLSQKQTALTMPDEQTQITAFETLKKEYPILAQYEALSKERMQSAGGYGKEELDKKLLVLANEISKDKKLTARLKRDVPQIDEAVRRRIENSKKRGIKH